LCYQMTVMRIGIVHTAGSPCRCAESVTEGLLALNHEPVTVDSEEIELHASRLAEECDLVIDHTDTYLGRGLCRPLVRVLLEHAGARIAGSPAIVCFLADNKAASKKRLAESGIPVPPGIVVHSPEWTLPGWLSLPLVLKPAFEHMSRGLTIAGTKEEAYQAADRLMQQFRQPVLVESYIAGRDLAVSLVAGPEGLQVLPILEWTIGADILSEEFKLLNPVQQPHRAIRAELSNDLQHELEELSRQAFIALGLRDYTRFDLRLSPNGSPYFLEANTTPSLEPLEALALSAKWNGLEYAQMVERLLAAAQSRYRNQGAADAETVRFELPSGPVYLKSAGGVAAPAQSTIELAALLDVRPGEEVLELGCGSGLLSIAAAKMGARRVVAVDLNNAALEATAANSRLNGVERIVELRAGSWYEALGTAPQRFDLIIATPPQTPGPVAFGPKYGGPDGTRPLFRVIRKAPDFLKPGQGRLWLVAITLANPRALRNELQKRFSEAVVVRETERPFEAGEYEAMHGGLFDYLCTLRDSNTSEFEYHEDGRGSFRNLLIRASGPRQP